MQPICANVENEWLVEYLRQQRRIKALTSPPHQLAPYGQAINSVILAPNALVNERIYALRGFGGRFGGTVLAKIKEVGRYVTVADEDAILDAMMDLNDPPSDEEKDDDEKKEESPTAGNKTRRRRPPQPDFSTPTGTNNSTNNNSTNEHNDCNTAELFTTP
mmetsp:Transcript_34929/g.57020  ORF Transcript_34929/g.57020 Transcript_34929/m.57020 type:complete len:161 (-) Transcript_34929:64-546(-)